jgi:hypothetical protein
MSSTDDKFKTLEESIQQAQAEMVESALQEVREKIAAAQARQARRAEMKSRLAAAAEDARRFYENDPELTAFTALDGEDFLDPE